MLRHEDAGVADAAAIAQTSGDQPPLLRRARLAALSTRRRTAGFAFAAVALLLLTTVLRSVQQEVGLSSVLLLYLAVSVATAAIGGIWPAVIAAVGGFVLANLFFIDPIGTLTVRRRDEFIALGVFLVVTVTVSVLADIAARRTRAAQRARAEAAALARLASTLVEGADPLPRLVRDLRAAFQLEAAAVLRPYEGGWAIEGSDPEGALTDPAQASDVIALPGGWQLALLAPDRRDARLADERRLLAAFAAQLAVAVSGRTLEARAATATALEEADALRSALLAAVSHDLRTPLASIKMAATSLLQSDVDLDTATRREFAQVIVADTDRLNTLVGNLLDASRVQTGTLRPVVRPTSLEEVVPAALASLGGRSSRVTVDVAETLPRVLADPALLERVIANLIDNAVKASGGAVVRVQAGAVPGGVRLRVVDRGPGIPAGDRRRVFEPFQRLGDRRADGGVGLGLAVARGFTDAIGGELTVEETPGGGTTMVVALPIAPDAGLDETVTEPVNEAAPQP